MQIFWQKGGYSPFWILASRGQKKPKEPQEALMRAINSAFWMELNITLKILAFCIPSFQSSWHFAFCILWGTKHPLNEMAKTRNDRAHCCHRPEAFQEGSFKLFFFHMVTDTITWGNQTINGIAHSIANYSVIC